MPAYRHYFVTDYPYEAVSMTSDHQNIKMLSDGFDKYLVAIFYFKALSIQQLQS